VTPSALLAWLAGGVLALLLLARVARRWLQRLAVRAIRRHGARVDRYKLQAKPFVAAELLTDPRIAVAVAEHARATGSTARDGWRLVERYIDEMVPSFNVLAYYRLGHPLAERILGLFYKVSVAHESPQALQRLPKQAVVIYLLNHRSNADYVLAGYALAGDVSISWAVGEWARAWPLEPLFKAFGSYFIRRRFRDPLYHTVLESYVQLITRNGVTQGIFPEGGLSRDGRLLPGKIGLFDYLLGIARDPAYRDRLYVVPVGINYDRVLEDRSLLREHARREAAERGDPPPRRGGRLRQLSEVGRYLGWNLTRLTVGRWRRYGLAAVTIGDPVPLAPWLETEGQALFDVPRSERLGRVQGLMDELMARIGRLMPVTPVPLVCAALQTLGSDFVSRAALRDRVEEVRDVLRELSAKGLEGEGSIDEWMARALEMLEMRRVLAPTGDGFAVLPRGRELISYYANSIAHLIGPFEAGVRERDQLLAELVTTAEQRMPTPVRGSPSV
jgi:glycerol-3-phosphate O-acyltransferase